MNARAVNVAILLLLVFELLNGFGTFLVGESGGALFFGPTALAGSPSSCSWVGNGV